MAEVTTQPPGFWPHPPLRGTLPVGEGIGFASLTRLYPFLDFDLKHENH